MDPDCSLSWGLGVNLSLDAPAGGNWSRPPHHMQTLHTSSLAGLNRPSGIGIHAPRQEPAVAHKRYLPYRSVMVTDESDVGGKGFEILPARKFPGRMTTIPLGSSNLVWVIYGLPRL